MSINLKLYLDEKAFNAVLKCALDDEQSRSDMRLLLVHLFSDCGYDFGLQFDRLDRFDLPLSNMIEVREDDDFTPRYKFDEE